MATLSSLRKRLGLSQRELADQLQLDKHIKISHSTIAMYESGKRTPSLETSKKIAEYFHRPVESISFADKMVDIEIISNI